VIGTGSTDNPDRSAGTPRTDIGADTGGAGDTSVDAANPDRAGAGAGGGRVAPALAAFLAVYLLGTFHRNALGVAGLQARARFGISPFQLSLFVLLQIGVYAAMQVPAGILVDRLGTKRLLLIASALMGVSSAAFAVVPNYGGALAARGALGVGDAMVFVSILRYASLHVSLRRYPLVVALTGTLGSVGNIASALPLTLLLRRAGWTPTFLGAAALTALVGAAVLVAAPGHEQPARIRRPPAELAAGLRRVRGGVAGAWRVPGTKLGFWVHFSCTCTMAFLGILWGMPFLVQARGFSREAAAAVLSLNVVVQVACTPIVGGLIARRPGLRVPLALSVAALTVAGWAALLLAGPSRAPDWALVALFAFTAVGGPASMIGFSIANEHNDRAVSGTASGIVNVGGWSAVVAASLLMGAALSLAGTSPAGYRAGMLAALTVPALGATQIARWWRRARR
jgi:MFS family permease